MSEVGNRDQILTVSPGRRAGRVGPEGILGGREGSLARVREGVLEEGHLESHIQNWEADGQTDQGQPGHGGQTEGLSPQRCPERSGVGEGWGRVFFK